MYSTLCAVTGYIVNVNIVYPQFLNHFNFHGILEIFGKNSGNFTFTVGKCKKLIIYLAFLLGYINIFFVKI